MDRGLVDCLLVIERRRFGIANSKSPHPGAEWSSLSGSFVWFYPVAIYAVGMDTRGGTSNGINFHWLDGGGLPTATFQTARTDGNEALGTTNFTRNCPSAVEGTRSLTQFWSSARPKSDRDDITH